MNKRAFCDVLSRRLGVRRGRLTSLVQRLSDSGQIRTNHSRRPDFDLIPVEMARMLLVGLVDNGLAQAASTVERYGQLRGRSSTLEQSIGWALARPESIVPMRSGIEIHTGDQPYAVFTVVGADGATTNVFGDIAEPENVDRLVTVSGAALRGIAMEVSGCTPGEVDALIRSVN